jgi:EmrB/QacA subfamily drug resistance transporter
MFERTAGIGETSAARPASPAWLTLASLSLVMLLASLGSSIANVALPTLTDAFHVSFQAAQWVVLAYLLATTSLIVSVGRIGDIVGRRRLLLAGLVIYGLASVACGLASAFWLLIAARAMQGFGAAIMMTLALALAGEVAPKETLGSAMGALGATSAVGTALGPSLGGALIAGFGWRAIFFASAPLTATALLLAHRSLPADRRRPDEHRPGFDAFGTLLLALLLVAYALAMTLGKGRFGALNLILLAAAIVGTGLFIVAETRAASPLLRLTMFRDRLLSGGLAMSALVSTVMMTTLVVGPFYLSRALGLGSTRVGVVMSVGPLLVALIGAPAGRMVDRLGAGRMTTQGLVAMAIGSATFAALPTSAGIPGYVAAIAVLTLGYALFQTANNTAVMRDVRPDQRGVVSGMLNLSRNLGLITGASVMGAIFAFASGTSNIAAAPAPDVAVGMRTAFAVAASLIVVALLLAVRIRTGAAQTAAPAVALGSSR